MAPRYQQGWASVVAIASLVGCAHSETITPQTAADRDVAAVSESSSTGLEAELLTRPRLSKTVTLGEGNRDPVYYAGAAQRGASSGAGFGTNVNIVNSFNTSTQTSNYYGGYGYGAYGTYGSRYAVAGSNQAFRGDVSRTTPTRTSSGTPPVAGDWPSPPNYGPRTMR